jgi:pimeloyl-ACP methyl ester carboxylesterase
MSRSANAGIVEQEGRYRLAIDQGIFGSAALGVGAIMNAVACGITLATGANDLVAPASDIAAAGFDPIVIEKAGHNVHVTAADEVWALFSDARRKHSSLSR